MGTKAEGWNEKRAFLKRGELQNQTANKNTQKVFFEEVARGFLELQKLHVKKKSFLGYRTNTNYLVFYLGKKEIKTITFKELNEMVIDLAKTKAPKTINLILDFAKGVFGFAKKEYGIENKAIDEVKRFKTNNRERFLSLDEIGFLKENIKNDEALKIFVALALSTGARLMGIMSILKKDINLDKGEVIINDFKNSSKYIGFLDKETRALIKKRLEDIGDDDRVVIKGRRLIEEGLRPILNRLFNEGVSDRKQKVVIHTLRHTFASHLAIKGVPIQIIQKLLNHKDIKMTMRYAHLMPQSGKEYVENLWG